MNKAHVIALDAINEVGTIAVPVIFDEGVAFIADAVPATLAGHELPRTLSADWCKSRGLDAKPGSSVLLPSFEGAALVLVSLGGSYNVAENYRLAAAAALAAARGGSVAFVVPTEAVDDVTSAGQALAEGAVLSAYDFKKSESDARFSVVPVGTPLPSVEDHDALTEGVARGSVIAESVNWAKRLIDTPPSQMNPKELAKQVANRLANEPHVNVEVWTESKIRDERLGGLLGVSAGSDEPARLVYVTYIPKDPVAHIALVGKGITFDSGGLSIKSGAGMMTMKTDMSGAAIVMATAYIASRLKLPVRVTAIAPMTENLLAGRATKPGDVLTARNGVTMEVLNTDAEGRLVLADGLSLAVEANPDAIIDVATLTGAQAVALGDEIGALFASTDNLADRLSDASDATGEPLWRLPLAARYEKHIDSDVADIKNIGKAGVAGSISAALFLQRFTDGRPWAHLDIAGPGRADGSRGYTTKGATAFSCRTLVEFLTRAAADITGTEQ